MTGMGDTGLERDHISTISDKGLRVSSETAGAKSGALDAERCEIDAELSELKGVWKTLPAVIRHSVLAVVRAVQKD